jgi:uncharacterized protein involved in outer membrane biogenesis
MKRLWVASVLAIFLIIVVVHEFLLPVWLERLRPRIEHDLSEALGLAVEIGDLPRVDLFPELEIEAQDVRVANLPGRASPSLLEVARLELELQVVPLLWRRIVIETLELYDADLRVEPDEAGAWSLAPDANEIHEAPEEEQGDPVRLAIHRLEIHDLRVRIGDEGETRPVQVLDLVIEADGPAGPLHLAGSGFVVGAGSIEIEAKTGSLADLIDPSGPIPLDLRAQIFEGRLDAEGHFGAKGTLRAADLRFGAEIADLARVSHRFDVELPRLGAVDVSGRLVTRDGPLAVESLSVRSRGDGPLELRIDGDIRDVRRLEGVDLEVGVALADVDLFQSLTSLPIPSAPFRADLDLDDDDGSLGIEGAVELRKPGAFGLDFEGGFDDLRRRRELDLRVAMTATTLDALSTSLAPELVVKLPELGPLEASGRLIIDEGRLQMQAIEAALGDPEQIWARAQGSIRDLIALSGVEIAAEIGASSASRLAEYFGRVIPDVGGLLATVALRDEDGTIGIEEAVVEVGRPGELELEVRGEFDHLRDLDELALQATLNARDLGVLARLVNSESDFTSVGSVHFSGKVRGSATGVRSRGELRLGKTHFRGEIDAARPPDGRPDLAFRLHSPLIHLPDLLGGMRSSAEDADGSGAPSGPGVLRRWWEGEARLPFDFLRKADVDLRIRADRLTGFEFLDIQDLRFTADLEKGRLVLSELGAEYESGRISGRAELDARRSTPRASIELETFNVDLTRLMGQFQEGTAYAGQIDLSVALDTKGTTVAQARSNLQGVFGAMLRNGSIVNRYSRAFALNVLRISMPTFLPDEQPEAPVRCLLGLARIEEGVAEVDTLYLAAPRITITGEGSIDLAGDEFDLRLTPRFHDPGLVAVAATVDVTGPLAKPDIHPLRRSMVTSALDSLARNATRPVRALGDVLGLRGGGAEDELEDPCGQVARLRVRQMRTDEVEPIDLQEIIEGGS